MVELETSVIRGSAAGPHLVITAGVHGDEFEGIAAVHQLMHNLIATELRGRVTLVPIVNKSAFDHNSRCGADSLDLARTCPGSSSGSVTQQVAAALTQLIQSADLYLDLHSGGVAMEVYPLAGYMLVESEHILMTQRRMARAFGLPLVWGTSDQLDGRSLSAARDAQVPAIYVEYLGGGRCNRRGVHAMSNGCLNVMAEYGMLEQERKIGPAPVIHESDEPGSGHMQVCYPAPTPGLFEPSVSLGQRVERGETIGVLNDSFSGESRAIPATETGAVIVLRSYPRVDRGDSLAVILEDAAELPPW